MKNGSFEKGKKVKIIANTNYHGYKLGEIVTMNNSGNERCFNALEDCMWCVNYCDVEEINESKEYTHEDVIAILSNGFTCYGQVCDTCKLFGKGNGDLFCNKVNYIGSDFVKYRKEIEMESTPKFEYKIGDIVRVVSNRNNHGFEIGELIIVKSLANNGSDLYESLIEGTTWYLSNDEVEFVKRIEVK